MSEETMPKNDAELRANISALQAKLQARPMPPDAPRPLFTELSRQIDELSDELNRLVQAARGLPLDATLAARVVLLAAKFVAAIQAREAAGSFPNLMTPKVECTPKAITVWCADPPRGLHLIMETVDGAGMHEVSSFVAGVMFRFVELPRR